VARHEVRAPRTAAHPHAEQVALHDVAVHAAVLHERVLEELLRHIADARVQVALKAQRADVRLRVLRQVVFVADVHEPVLLDRVGVHLRAREERRERVLDEEVVQQVRHGAVERGREALELHDARAV
jgi:hypothetical protein